MLIEFREKLEKTWRNQYRRFIFFLSSLQLNSCFDLIANTYFKNGFNKLDKKCVCAAESKVELWIQKKNISLPLLSVPSNNLTCIRFNASNFFFLAYKKKNRCYANHFGGHYRICSRNYHLH